MERGLYFRKRRKRNKKRPEITLKNQIISYKKNIQFIEITKFKNYKQFILSGNNTFKLLDYLFF